MIKKTFSSELQILKLLYHIDCYLVVLVYYNECIYALAHIQKDTLPWIHIFWSTKPHALHFLAVAMTWSNTICIYSHFLLDQEAAFVHICIYWVGTEGDSHLAEVDSLHLPSHLHLLKRAQLPLVEWVSFAMHIVDTRVNQAPKFIHLHSDYHSFPWFVIVKLERFCFKLKFSVQDWVTVCVNNLILENYFPST